MVRAHRSFLSIESSEIVVVEHAVARRQQLDLAPPGDEALAVLEHLDDVAMCRRHRGHSYLGAPVQVRVTGLRRRHFEAAAQLGDDRPHDRPLLFQRMDVAQQQVKRNRAYNHASLSYVTTGR